MLAKLLNVLLMQPPRNAVVLEKHSLVTIRTNAPVMFAIKLKDANLPISRTKTNALNTANLMLIAVIMELNLMPIWTAWFQFATNPSLLANLFLTLTNLANL